MLKKWELYKADEQEVKKIASENNLSPLLTRILLNRGIREKEEIDSFLYPKIETLGDPYLLNDMATAVSRIVKARENHEKVTIYGDYDVDGITSVSVLFQYFQDLGIQAEYYLPSRLEEGYGLNEDAILKIKNSGTSLLVTVDCGISALEEVEYAKSIGLDVIVTDHHECPEVIPKAVAVIDPKREDDTYPFHYLAGVGVAFKLIHAISIRLCLDRKSYLKYLDIVCLGTVADIVPLVKENRVIVKYGLMLLEKTKNIGLKSLIEASGYTKVNSSMISFGLAPRINACGRMGKADLALELLLTNDEERAKKIATELNTLNKERQDVEKRIFDEVVEMVESEKLYENDVIIVGQEGWHHGVIGIVASKITELYYKPSILVCFEEGIGKGSGRSIEGFDLHAALTSCCGDLIKFGGHEMAIGLTVDKTRFEQFKEDMNCYAKEKMPKEKNPTLIADAEMSANYVSLDSLSELEKLEPYGESNAIPLFLYRNLKVEGIRLLSNEKHLKLILKDDMAVFDAVAFNMGGMKYSIKVGDKIDILHYLDVNRFNNLVKIQLNIKDIKKSL